MQACLDGTFIFRAEKLGDDDGCAGGKACKKTYDQIDDLRGGPSDAGKRVGPYKLSDDDGVNGIVQLLEECAE